MVGERQRRRARAALAAVDRDEVGARAGSGHAATSCCQKPGSPTADLMPTGRPVSAAIPSMNSISPSTSANAECAGGLTQSRPAAMLAHGRDVGVTLAAGSRPPRPGLAPWESLISIARTGASAMRSRSRSRLKRPRSSRQPK